MPGPRIHAQSAPAPSVPSTSSSSTGAVVAAKAASHAAASSLALDSDDQTPAEPASMGIIRGTVTAPDGDVVVGALVTLVAEASKSQRTVLTDTTGDFNFTGLSGGTFQLTVTSRGFAPWAGRKILLEPGQNYQVPPIVLAVATASTTVTAVFTGRDLAEHQVHVEEKQRVLGIVPNFYTSYVWNAEPLTSKQKFQLAWRTSIDPVTFLGSGVIAGIEQWQNDFSGYGPGIEGYAKRYGANYADGFIGVMIGGAILPSILHQDPRYFYKGTGSIRSRALYAISTTAICKGDNGQWQPNYSNVLGTVAAAGISNAYYPANDRGVLLTIDNSLIGLAAGAGTALLQEFLLRKISRGVPASADAQP